MVETRQTYRLTSKHRLKRSKHDNIISDVNFIAYDYGFDIFPIWARGGTSWKGKGRPDSVITYRGKQLAIEIETSTDYHNVYHALGQSLFYKANFGHIILILPAINKLRIIEVLKKLEIPMFPIFSLDNFREELPDFLTDFQLEVSNVGNYKIPIKSTSPKEFNSFFQRIYKGSFRFPT